MCDIIEPNTPVKRRHCFSEEIRKAACQILDNLKPNEAPSTRYDRWTVLQDLLLMTERVKNKSYPALPRSKPSKKMRKQRLKSYNLKVSHLNCVKQLVDLGFSLKELKFIGDKIIISQNQLVKQSEQESAGPEIIAID